MRYIKGFNESLNRVELKEFCDMYLSYLLDKPHFNLNILSSSEEISTIKINDNIDFDTFSGDKIFNWSDVSDDFIPFIEVLDKSYKIESIYIFKYGMSFRDTGLKSYSINELRNLPYDTKMKSIEISVSKKSSSFLQKAKSFFKI